MTNSTEKAANRRILVIDDNEAIHADYAKILALPEASESARKLDELHELIFGGESERRASEPRASIAFELTGSLQGQEAVAMASEARERGNPFAMAFVDMRMPPGWDGLKTIEEMWKVDPRVQIVICSAYSDYSWEEIFARLGRTDQLLILKKPFDHAEVYQLAAALTEKWNAAQGWRDLTSELEGKVQERTAALETLNRELEEANAKLEKSVEQARCASQAKSRFLATMSHEIRTTLNGIMGASFMLLEGDLDEKNREFARIIHSSGEALMTIINDILDFSKYGSGQLKLDVSPFSPAKLAKECAALNKPLFAKNGVAFSLELSEDLPAFVLGDKNRIRQILLNILNNAIKFSKDETVTLAVTADGGREVGESRLGFAVRDTGIGMSEEAQSRLFQAFMQADSSTTRQYGGTGLGLAICKLLADAMGGEIAVESAYGEGSTFTFSVALPIAEKPPSGSPAPAGDSAENAEASPAEAASPKGEAAPAASAGTAEEPGAFFAEASEAFEPSTKDPADAPSADARPRGLDFPRRALVIDDNPINSKLARHFIGALDIEVDCAGDGEEGVSAFVPGAYDIVLMDLQMPVMDGYQATAAIRRLERQSGGPEAPKVPIIALTANAFSEVKESCLEAGMNDFIAKPLRMPELKATLEKWLGAGAN